QIQRDSGNGSTCLAKVAAGVFELQNRLVGMGTPLDAGDSSDGLDSPRLAPRPLAKPSRAMPGLRILAGRTAGPERLPGVWPPHSRAQLARSLHHSFNPCVATPSINAFCANTNNTSTGAIVMNVAAMTWFHGVPPCWRSYICRPIISVYFCC